jgi:hypothetical protein
LLPEDTAAALDLQQTFMVVYEITGYDQLVDYAQPPPGSLAPADASWVEERLRLAGRRKS